MTLFSFVIFLLSIYELKMTSNICDVEKLVELFGTVQNGQYDDEVDISSSQSANIECSSNSIARKKINPYAKLEPAKRERVRDPEAEDPEKLFFDDVEYSQDLPGQKNWKNTPKWDISYRQSVTPSDVFLAMGFKNPSTSSCENMLISIHLPGENRQNIDLKIDKERLILTSPKFYLDLKLPHPVDPKKGNAEFDKEAEKLKVTLIMDRELDLVNF